MTKQRLQELKSRAQYQTPECFEEMNGNLYLSEQATGKLEKIGKVTRQGWDATATFHGQVVASSEQNTGWGLV